MEYQGLVKMFRLLFSMPVDEDELPAGGGHHHHEHHHHEHAESATTNTAPNQVSGHRCPTANCEEHR